MNDIKAIFFDADDTLVDHMECERQALAYLFQKMGIDYSESFRSIFRQLDRQLWNGEYTIPVSATDIPIYRFKRFFELININYPYYAKANELFKEGLANTTALLENAEDVVKHLHQRGFVLCVATNGLVALQKPRIANSAIGRYISHIAVSEEVGAPKPSPLIFNALLDKANISAAQAIMVGDSLEKDVQGAKNAGIKSVWYNPDGAINATPIVPDYEIHRLPQLIDLFSASAAGRKTLI